MSCFLAFLAFLDFPGESLETGLAWKGCLSSTHILFHNFHFYATHDGCCLDSCGWLRSG
jgi:hypothetical protein